MNRPLIKKCINCHKIFKLPKTWLKQKFCSRKCFSSSSSSKLYCKGRIPWNKGKHTSSETKKKIGDANRGRISKLRKGKKITNSNGYILFWQPNHPNATSKRVFEHRLVMEKYLGRYLESWEIVHHINKIRNDNRLKNLKLVSRHTHYGDITCPKCGFKFLIS